MKLFIKDHIDIVIVYISNMIILFLLYSTLGGFSKVINRVYFIFLTTVMLSGLLLYRYFRKKRMYTLLEKKSNALQDTLREESGDPLSTALFSFNNRNYNLYLAKISDYRDSKEEWKIHTMQWVHQMKTPISVMRLLLQNPEKEIDNFSLSYELDRLQNQLDLILNLARIERFEKDFRIEKVSLDKIIRQAINEEKRFFIQSDVFPKYQKDINHSVYTDKKWISFVVQQLIHNAIKFSQSGKSVYIYTCSEPGKTSLIIKDKGIGIEKRDIHRIFDLYYTGENGRKFSASTGIGLYLVDEIIKKLQHDISVTSSNSDGTKFIITFQQKK